MDAGSGDRAVAVTPDATDATVRAVAGTVIGGRGNYPREPLAAAPWARLVATVRGERLQPQLASAIASRRLPASEDQAGEAERMHAAAMATALMLDRQLLETATLLGSRSIPFRVVKGPAAAHLDYPDPSQRAYGDIDLLVPSQHVDRAVTTLTEAGGRRSYREPLPGFDRRFGKGMSFRMPSNLEVDVHRTLALGPFGLALDPDGLWDREDSFELGGRRMLAMDRSRRFLHACYHAMLGRGRPRFLPLIDLVLTAPMTDEDRWMVETLARRWQADTVVQYAVASARMQLGWEVPTGVAEMTDRLAPTPRQQRWLKGYRGRGRSSARLTLTAVEAIEGWHNRFDYVHAVLWPRGQTPSSALARFRGAVAASRPRRP